MIYEAELLHLWELPDNRQKEILECADWHEDPEEYCNQFMYWHHPEVDPGNLEIIVWSTEDVMRIDDPVWDGALSISNNSGLLVKINEEKIKVKYV